MYERNDSRTHYSRKLDPIIASSFWRKRIQVKLQVKLQLNHRVGVTAQHKRYNHRVGVTAQHKR